MIEINKIFQPLYTSPKRYFLLTGGRASLKSTTVSDLIARLTFEKGQGILFTRYTMTSAERSVIPEFLITLERLGITKHFDVTKSQITNKTNGSFIYFSGIKTSSGDQTANLKSIAGITTWVIDEGEEFTDEFKFETIDDSIRSGSQQNRVIWIQNPSTTDHFIYKRWIEPKNKQIDVNGFKVTVSDLDQVEHIHSTYHMAQKYLSSGWIEKADYHLSQVDWNYPNDSWYYRNYIGGWLENAPGAIYRNWVEGEFDETIPFVYGLDWGFHPDPLAMVKVAVDWKRKKIYVNEEIYETNLSTRELAKLAKDICGENFIAADHNEGRTIQDLYDYGLNIEKAIKGKIIEGIRAIQGFQLIVTPNSHNLKKELKNYAWSDRKSSLPIDAYNHGMDAMRYGYNEHAYNNGF